MSYNLHLKASVEARLQLGQVQEKRTITENCLLWQTPTEITEEALNSDNPLDVYVSWIRDKEPRDTEVYGIVRDSLYGDRNYNEREYRENTDESGVPWEKLEKIELLTPRKEHENNVFEWIIVHKDWKIEWYGM